MRILIICEKFAPENTVGAIRMSKTAKYLKKNHNCEITVLARTRGEYSEPGDAKYVDHFLFADESAICRKVIAAYKRYSGSARYDEKKRNVCESLSAEERKKQNGIDFKAYLKSILSVLYSEYTPRSYCRRAMKAIDRSGLRFDAVISSFGPASSHYIAGKMKKRNPGIKWIADYRDPLAIGESTKGFLHNWAVNFAKRITGTADAYTVASYGFVRCLGLKDSDKVNVINNGFDRDDYIGIITGKNVPHEKMKLVYTGTLFAGSRDITVILKAFNDLINEGSVDRNRLEIIYAGQHKSEFLYQYQNSGLDISVSANDVIPKAEAAKLQNEADLLLIAAWNTEEYQGSLPLKIYEYLYVGKPVVCSICGTAANSELKQIIDNCDAGICYESVNHQHDYQKLKDRLLEYYHVFLKHGYIEQKPEGINKTAVSVFDYENLTERFWSLIKP